MTENLKMPRRVKQRCRGVTLIEAVLYIAISLALIVGGLVFFQQTSTASGVSAMTRLLSATIAETRLVLQEQPADAPIVDAAFEELLFARGAVPPSFIDTTQISGAQFRHPWGGAINLRVNQQTTGNRIQVRILQIPTPVCARMLATDGTGKTLFTTGFTDATVTDNVGGGLVAVTGPGVTPNAAGAACRQADVDGDGEVNLFSRFRNSD